MAGSLAVVVVFVVDAVADAVVLSLPRNICNHGGNAGRKEEVEDEEGVEGRGEDDEEEGEEDDNEEIS